MTPRREIKPYPESIKVARYLLSNWGHQEKVDKLLK
jgi:hypothetical protein